MANPREFLDRLDALHAAADETPWHVDPQDDHRVAAADGGGVTSTYLPDDAALIVAAVNALPKLTAALRAVLEIAELSKRDSDLEITTRHYIVHTVCDAITEALS